MKKGEYTNPVFKKDGKLVKFCNKCQKYKETTEFNKNRRYWHGLSDYCRICNYSRAKEYKKKYPEIVRAWKRKWKKNNMEKVRILRRKIQSSTKYKIKRNQKLKDKRKNNREWVLRQSFSQRIRYLLKSFGVIKTHTTLKLLGCSIKELKSYLSLKFKNGMTWENYGRKGWHIDHIIPCSYFDLSKLEEQQRCFHYTNLQPLWWYENVKKSDKLPIGFTQLPKCYQ